MNMKENLSLKTFDTTSIYLSSAILTVIETTSLKCIDAINRVDGKRVIKISYPEEREADLLLVLEDFNARCLQIDLYQYNRNLTILKGKLLGEKRREVS